LQVQTVHQVQYVQQDILPVVVVQIVKVDLHLNKDKVEQVVVVMVVYREVVHLTVQLILAEQVVELMLLQQDKHLESADLV
tara:strand:+ start:270 stop:512 length:243 start_codon:yes stop_codon:yes gene_type:complete